jgi:hypothetical protein
MFNETANPIGVVRKVDEIEKKIEKYQKLWDLEKKKRAFTLKAPNLHKITNFLLMVLDDFVVTISTVLICGPDKKATVLDALDRLYEYTVKEAMPIWMRPFAAPIKHYIVYVLVSSAIDWMVEKYQSGSWRPSLEKEFFESSRRWA